MFLLPFNISKVFALFFFVKMLWSGGNRSVSS